MSFKKFDQQTFIVDTANAYTNGQISKREFLRKLGLAGVGFSAFSLGMLGSPRGLRKGSLLGTPAYADGLPDNQAKWLKEVGSKFKGAKIRYSTESTPPSVILNQIKKEFTDPTGIEVEVEIVPLEQVLAKATQDVQGQLGSYDLYYLDQSWISMFQPDCIDPVAYYKDKPELAMPDFDWDDFSKPLVKNVAQVDGQWMGIPFDIPIFTLMYRKDILEKHKIAVPTTYEDYLAAARQITEAEKGNGIFGTGLQAKSGHYSLECDWSQAVWGHGGSIFNKSKKFSGNDEQGIAGLKWYQDLLKVSPPNSTASTWDGQFEMMHSGQIALAQSWDEFFPGLDADDSKVKGLWEPAKPLTAKKLRPASEAGFNEQPNLGHQGGSCISLSKYSKNKEAAWIFMQWGCCKEIMTRCTLLGGFAPMRNSSFADPRVKAKAKVGAGTTRHLETVKWVIDNAMATEPHMALWAGLSTNEIPTELGKLLTGQAYGGDPKKCMDALAKQIDAQVKDAGLL
ncbi:MULTISPECIES: ABC transporter substrate-binding protein [unclassified Bradyrhizobium]|uniref:ABC transporter substrate-binding protein n=1 Tax=unclassified Bradyrhizobium TaxID=2631580 RepID=UPI000415AF1F|nr:MULTISPECIES: extracellular solute-binding protein [unclassified Bradyrhizobium]QIG91191.1 extracellular solute-binding protein [Bradyrhizobium sp. 6(2017)]